MAHKRITKLNIRGIKKEQPYVRITYNKVVGIDYQVGPVDGANVGKVARCSCQNGASYEVGYYTDDPDTPACINPKTTAYGPLTPATPLSAYRSVHCSESNTCMIQCKDGFYKVGSGV